MDWPLFIDGASLDMAAVHRDAIARVREAYRLGRLRNVLRWGRVRSRARRVLRYKARMRAGTVWREPYDSHPLFSDILKTDRATPRPPRPAPRTATADAAGARPENDAEAPSDS